MALSRELLVQRASAIRLAVFDVDGVMTDGRLYRDDRGHELKAFHSRDGLGIKALINNGIRVGVLTARSSPLVDVRMAELGIDLLVQGREDKAEAFDELMARAGVTRDQTSYAGDDLVDWPAMSRAALSFAPADADPWIRQHADWITGAAGGRGAVREICELLLEARSRLDAWREGFK